ncbi:MAG: hypothetical protein ABIP55_09510 [Tepidisphaeraceae bacterium]
MTTRTITIILFLLAACGFANAKNVDLSTVPKRNTVALTIYNSEDITLVRETRTVTFKKGVNPLQFSWANTLIDPTSVELRFLTQPDKLDVLDTTFPHDKPQMLYWNVQSEFDGEATIEITYFTSGITWSADYLALADKEEKVVRLDGFVRVSNNSGEEYEEASVRLIVGTINLVEKIAQLAQIPMQEVDKLDGVTRQELRSRAARGMMKAASDSVAAAPATAAPEEKQIIKEGLSEYFIFSIEGTETIRNGWSKRMRAIEAASVPLKIQYRYRPAEYGDQLVRMYLMTNDEKSKLGTTPLPDGVVRIFKESGRGGEGREGGLSYLTQQSIKYIPIGDKIELNLGKDPEVVFELIKRRTFRDNIWVQLHGGNIFRRVDDGNIEVDVRSTVAGWDEHEVYAQRIRNYTSKPIELEIRRAFPGHVVFRSRLNPTPHDYQTVQFVAPAKAGEKLELPFEIVRKQGRNAKQNNVTLEAADVARP